MPAEPQIKALPIGRRKFVFRSFLLVFLVVLPAIIFYATGYRFDFSKNATTIVSTGGMYVSVPADDADIYINEELVQDIRVFRNASYIQNLEAGVHKVHTQGEGLYTWVKDLPIMPHIVTGVQSFNMPLVPQVRLVAPYLDAAGVGTYADRATTTVATDFAFASSSTAVSASTTVATTTLAVNEEYDYVVSLFSTTTEEDTLVDQLVAEVSDVFTLPAATTSATTTEEMATTTVLARNTTLFERSGKIYVTWTGSRDAIPYYYCIEHGAASTTQALYGDHVLASLANVAGTIPETQTQQVAKRVCRDEIEIDSKGEEVYFFTFMPGSTDLVLMHRESGVFVVEIDDRAWQNTQQLYPHGAIMLHVENDQIYIADNDYYLELFTEIQ